ncbi:helix-turn-helix transcriptional regulator [Marinobacter flavimaris]|uniref:helix-turn-helix transcriptional regulator n=2 Tax=Marinobacter TaxID=2742 RepID=UPI003865AA48
MQDVALLFISDPETNIRVSADVLKQLYELTPAETKLAIGLLNGLNLGEIAELNGNSVTTLRVQLRSIFDKTGVKRQQELVRLLVMLSVNRSD